MILVTGATGTVGSEVVRELVRRGARVRAMSRRPDRATPAGADTVFGDFGDPASLAAAARGVEALFLASAPGPTLPAHDLAMVRAATAANIGTIVKLSAIGTPEEEGDGLGSWHQPGEAAVRGSGAAWTILRPTTFASNALSWVDEVRTGRPVPNLTGAGTQGVVDPADIAAAAAVALTERGHAGRIYTLTGPELLSAADQATAIGEAVGRTVTTVDVPLDQAREQMLAAGLPKEFADTAVEGSALVRAGGNAVLTDDLEWILGRRPTSFAEWAQKHRSAFR